MGILGSVSASVRPWAGGRSGLVLPARSPAYSPYDVTCPYSPTCPFDVRARLPYPRPTRPTRRILLYLPYPPHPAQRRIRPYLPYPPYPA